MPISRSCMRRSRTRSKKGLSPDEKRDVVRHMHEAHGVSIRQGCQAASLPRSTYRYERRERDDSDVITALSELVEQKPGIGFWQAFDRLRRAGPSWNHKRVYRIYTAMQLNIQIGRASCRERV